eukprot:Opistho-2@93796
MAQSPESLSTRGSNGVVRRRLVILTLLGFVGLTATLSVVWKRLPVYSANPDRAIVALPDSLTDGRLPAQWSDLPPPVVMSAGGLTMLASGNIEHAAGQYPEHSTTTGHPAAGSGSSSSAPSASPGSPATSTASPIDSVLMLHWTPWCSQYSSGPFGPMQTTRKCPISMPQSGVPNPPSSAETFTCSATVDRARLREASLVLFHVPEVTTFKPEDYPSERYPHQQWLCYSMESPSKIRPQLSTASFMSMFNASSTYRVDSDFPIPYGPPSAEAILNAPFVPLSERNSDVPVAFIASNCDSPNGRTAYVAELMRHIGVASYGKCLNNRPGGISARNQIDRADTDRKVGHHKFMLVFENGHCGHYITEKLANALIAGVVPVVWGPEDHSDYERWAPAEGAFIFAGDFASPRNLAAYLNMLNRNDALLLPFLRYRLASKILNPAFGAHTYLLNDFCGMCNAARRAAAQLPASITGRTTPPPDLSCNTTETAMNDKLRPARMGIETVPLTPFALCFNASYSHLGADTSDIAIARAIFRTAPRGAPLAMYFAGGVVATADNARLIANAILREGVALQSSPQSKRIWLSTPLNWAEEDSSDSQWVVALQSFRHLQPLLHAFAVSPDDTVPQYLPVVRHALFDWYNFHVRRATPGKSEHAWQPSVAGIRAFYLAFVIDTMRRRPVHLAYVVTQEMIDLLDLARACVEALRRILNDKVAATIASLPALLGVAALARALPEIVGSDNDYQRASKGFRDVVEAYCGTDSVPRLGDDPHLQLTELEAVYATNVFTGDEEVTALMTRMRGKIGSIATLPPPALQTQPPS